MKGLKQGAYSLQFTRVNVDYKIRYIKKNSEEREDDGVSVQSLWAYFEVGPKKLGLKVIDRDGHVDYSVHSEGPGMDDHAGRIRFLSFDWSAVMLNEHVPQHFLKLYIHSQALLLDGTLDNSSSDSNSSDESDREGLTIEE